jgi:hypothetical protein
MHQVTPTMINRYKFLNHLKLGSMFFFVEVDLKPLVSNHTLKQYYHLLKDRAKVRSTIRREEEHYNYIIQNMYLGNKIAKPRRKENLTLNLRLLRGKLLR